MYAHSHIQAGPVRPVAECATRIRSGQWWGSEGQCADSHGGRERGRTCATSCVLLCMSACVCVCLSVRVYVCATLSVHACVSVRDFM